MKDTYIIIAIIFGAIMFFYLLVGIFFPIYKVRKVSDGQEHHYVICRLFLNMFPEYYAGMGRFMEIYETNLYHAIQYDTLEDAEKKKKEITRTEKTDFKVVK